MKLLPRPHGGMLHDRVLISRITPGSQGQAAALYTDSIDQTSIMLRSLYIWGRVQLLAKTYVMSPSL